MFCLRAGERTGVTHASEYWLSSNLSLLHPYPRRPNDNLLLDYGFAILDNMWDAVEVPLGLVIKDEESAYSIERKKRLLYSIGHHPNSIFPFRRTSFPVDAINFARVAVLNDAELDHAERVQDEAKERDNKAVTAAAAASAAALAAAAAGASGSADTEVPQPLNQECMESTSDTDTDTDDCDGDSKQNEKPPQLHTPPSSKSNMSRGIGILSASTELQAVVFVKSKILEMQQSFGFTAAEDEEFLQLLKDQADAKENSAAVDDGSTDGEEWKMVSAVTYRLTRKHILDATLLKLELVECFLRGLLAKKRMQAVSQVLAAASSNNIFTPASTYTDTGISSSFDSLAPVSSLPTQLNLPEVPPRHNQDSISPSRQLFEEMRRIDMTYSVNQPSSGVSPYVTTGSSTSFRGPKTAAQAAETEAGTGTGTGAGTGAGTWSDTASNRHEYQLRAYLQKITNESLVLSIERESEMQR